MNASNSVSTRSTGLALPENCLTPKFKRRNVVVFDCAEVPSVMGHSLSPGFQSGKKYSRDGISFRSKPNYSVSVTAAFSRDL